MRIAGRPAIEVSPRLVRGLLLGAAIGLGLVVLLGTLSPTPIARAAEPVTYTVSFDKLMPGEPQTDSVVIPLARTATLHEARWLERSGLLADSELAIQICPVAGACVSTGEAIGREFAAGDLRLLVTASASADTQPGETGSALGVLVFVADEGELPLTGATGVGWIAIVAAGAVVAGFVLVRLGRRNRGAA